MLEVSYLRREEPSITYWRRNTSYTERTLSLLLIYYNYYMFLSGIWGISLIFPALSLAFRYILHPGSHISHETSPMCHADISQIDKWTSISDIMFTIISHKRIKFISSYYLLTLEIVHIVITPENHVVLATLP